MSGESDNVGLARTTATTAPPPGRQHAWSAAREPSDAALMALLAAGHTAALGQLVTRHQRHVRTLAYRVLGRWDAADDVCQDAFLRVYRSASTYRPEAAFSTWLHRIVVNLCLDRAKRPHLDAIPDRESPADAAAPPDGHMLRQERLDAIRQAVASLPGRQRVAVVLHRYEGLSHAQVARTTGWSQSAVESLLVRAYAELRHQLRGWLDV